jgi:thioredoxin reductase (NADPH)
MMVEYNTIILGAGISGISCGIYLKRAGIRTLIVENNVPGGQLNKASVIENYPGFISILGSDLTGMLLEQVSNYEIDIVYDEVNNIDYDKKILIIGDTKYSYKNLVFATGRRERLLGIEDEDKLIGRGISLCATCDGALYKNRVVSVVGGGASAVSEAIYLSNIASKVYLIYRGSELRAEEILKDRIKQIDNIEIVYERNIVSYLVEDEKLAGVKLDNGDEIRCDCLFVAIGHIPNSELFVGNKTDGYIEIDEYGETSIDDVYACGDVINKEVYQLVTASSEGIMVASSIIRRNMRK